MKKRETVAMQDEYIDKLTKNLPVLRAAAHMTQASLAEKVGVSRQTIVAVETRKRPMPWILYLAMMFVFMQHEESNKLVKSFNLFD
ncbi:MAG: helix-turn-helix domain-containing protein [Oscillospiraceae bacterium]|jgi:DNA-binding XRE family transcriptional regulator|nr:helix-turn-helix domain-containing protein [Oscillospiraceae bacterium]